MNPLPLLIALLLCLLPSVAVSESPPIPGRFTLTPVGDGFLKLDSATGAVSICHPKESDFVCEAVADEATELRREIDRLSEENDGLHKQLAETHPSQAPEQAPQKPLLQVPKIDFDELTDLAANVLRRLQEMVRELAPAEPQREL
jgi:hypothetical protein